MNISNFSNKSINNNTQINLKNNVYSQIKFKDNYDTVSFKGQKVGRTSLSKTCDIMPESKYFKIISLPKGAHFEDNKIKIKEKVPTVAVVDFFREDANKKFNGDVKVSHGDLVTKIALSGLEDKVGALVLSVDPNYNDIPKGILDALSELADMQEKYGNIDAVNISVGYSGLFEDFENVCNQTIDSSNCKNFKKVLLDYFKKIKTGKYKYVYETIQAINKLVKNGTQVYISSGNNPLGFELLSLADAQHIVSTSDYRGSSTAFANEKEKGEYVFKTIFDEKGKIVELTDGKNSFSAEELDVKDKKRSFMSKLFEGDSPKIIKGTSFASPAKLNQDFKEKLKD